MISSDFRTEARRKLDGKWGKAALIMLAYCLIFFLINFIEGLLPDSYTWIANIINLVIEIPLSFGLIFAFINLYKDVEVKSFDFLKLGFGNFGKSWGITFQIFLKMLIPTILIIVSYILIIVGSTLYGVALLSTTTSYYAYLFILIVGFILLVVSAIWATTKSFYYQLSYIIAVDNEAMSAEDTVLESEKLMTGKRAKLFWLQLSFIGWAILAAITLGIGFLWLMPYIQFATIVFYEFAKGNTVTTEIDTSDNNGSTEE